MTKNDPTLPDEGMQKPEDEVEDVRDDLPQEEEGGEAESPSPPGGATGDEPGEPDEIGNEADVEEGTEDDVEAGPEAEVEALREELAQLRDKHLRLAAEFENYRKRMSADLAAGWVRAQADLVRSLAEGLDDLQRVSQFTSEDTTVDALIEGVDLVERNFLKALGDAGLEVLNPVGEKFDPNVMEAMMRVPAEEDGQDETVHQVFQKGYMFKDQLVRPARVSVYKDDD
jgi:molecular chaperone GrpE